MIVKTECKEEVEIFIMFMMKILIFSVTTLQNACRDAILQYTNSKAVELLPLPKSLKEYLLYRA